MRGIDLTWAGGEHTFNLDIELLRALQQRCDAGPAWVLHRLQNSMWHVDDVLATISLGLEGGGLSKDEARRLTKLHVEPPCLARCVLIAQLVLMHALYGEQETDEGDNSAGERAAAAA